MNLTKMTDFAHELVELAFIMKNPENYMDYYSCLSEEIPLLIDHNDLLKQSFPYEYESGTLADSLVSEDRDVAIKTLIGYILEDRDMKIEIANSIAAIRAILLCQKYDLEVPSGLAFVNSLTYEDSYIKSYD